MVRGCTLCECLAIVAVVLLLWCHGCTVHFKATDVELDAVGNATYELEKVDLFSGLASK